MLEKSHVSMVAICLPSSELGRAAVLGWWERHKVCGEKLQLSCGGAPASPLGAAAGSDPGQRRCPGPQGFSWRAGLESVCFLHLCEVGAPGPWQPAPLQ